MSDVAGAKPSVGGEGLLVIDRPVGLLAIFSLSPLSPDSERPQKNLPLRKSSREPALDYLRVDLLEHSRYAGHCRRVDFDQVLRNRVDALRVRDRRADVRVQIP